MVREVLPKDAVRDIDLLRKALRFRSGIGNFARKLPERAAEIAATGTIIELLRRASGK
jgi:hypothetical protein